MSQLFESRCPLRVWGEVGIDFDQASIDQMEHARRLPISAAAAMMPDAHVGYGIPIGGVLATRQAIVPYAVGVDIACRMKLTVLDLPPASLTDDQQQRRLGDAIEAETRFGVGAEFKRNGRQHHPVLDSDWSVSPITKMYKDRAWSQLGTSGSGNHFVEFGELTVLPDPSLDSSPSSEARSAPPEPSDHESRRRVLQGGSGWWFELPPGTYVALLSHSGSRGTGASVCAEYSKIATALKPDLPRELRHLAWLDLNSQPGREYWDAMNLMGEYAAANHAVIHRNIARHLGAEIIAGVENHHNFAWKERHIIDGVEEELIVHRKGATPAGKGVLGVIPGSMAAPGFIVRGKGNTDSLLSASHGAGRVMSRTQARQKYRFGSVRGVLAKQGITVLSAGADESPGVYKDIHTVMARQSDLVEVLARFDPKIVKMAPEGEKPED